MIYISQIKTFTGLPIPIKENYETQADGKSMKFKTKLAK